LTGSLAPDLPTYLPLGLTHEADPSAHRDPWPDGLLAIGALIVWWGSAAARTDVAVAGRSGAVLVRRAGATRGSGGTRASAAQWLGWLALSELVGLATPPAVGRLHPRDGYFAEHWSLLDRSIDGHPIFNLLQFWCSVVGMAVVAAYLVVEWRRRREMAAAAFGGPQPPRGTGSCARRCATPSLQWSCSRPS